MYCLWGCRIVKVHSPAPRESTLRGTDGRRGCKRTPRACGSALSTAGRTPAIARLGAKTAPHASKPRWRAVRAALPCVWLVQPTLTWSENIRRTQDRQIKPTCSHPKRRSHLQMVHFRGLENSTTRKTILAMMYDSNLFQIRQGLYLPTTMPRKVIAPLTPLTFLSCGRSLA
jgi:hypothetical protein